MLVVAFGLVVTQRVVHNLQLQADGTLAWVKVVGCNKVECHFVVACDDEDEMQNRNGDERDEQLEEEYTYDGQVREGESGSRMAYVGHAT